MRSSVHIILSIKDSLQQQIHFNGNIFGNNAVVVTRVHCIHIIIDSSNFLVGIMKVAYLLRGYSKHFFMWKVFYLQRKLLYRG